MISKQVIIQKMIEQRVVAVIRAKNPVEAEELVSACVEGGILNIEITFSVPYAHEVITVLSKKYAGTDVLVGAGTVLDAPTARTALLAGAQFVVSPCLIEEVVRMCNRYGILCIPGAMTIKEVLECMESGADIVKIFPGDANGGISFIKAIKGPLPSVSMMITGGVDLNNMQDWLRAGAEMVGIGSDLTKGFNGTNREIIIAKAKEYVKKAKE